MENKDLDKILKQSAESAKQFGESISQVIKEFIEFAEKKMEDTNKEEDNKVSIDRVINDCIDIMDRDMAMYGFSEHLILINPENIEHGNNFYKKEGYFNSLVGCQCIATDSVEIVEVYRKIK